MQAEGGEEGRNEVPSYDGGGPNFYQLTHDYLVPSLREWLGRKAAGNPPRPGRNPLGRTGPVLECPDRSQAAAVVLGMAEHVRADQAAGLDRAAGADDAGGPSAPSGTGRDGGRRARRAGDRWVGWCTVSQHTQNLVARLLEADTAGVPDIVQHMSLHRSWVDPLLAEAAKTDDPKKSLHVSSGPIAAGRRPDSGYLRDRLLDGQPVEVRVIRDALRPHASQSGR